MKLIDRILMWNPLAGRYAFTQLRPLNAGVSAFTYACALVMIVLLNLVGYRPLHRPMENVLRDLYASTVAFQILLLWVVGVYNSGSVVREAMLEKSLDFLRLLPISPHARIVGMLVGRNLMLLALATVNGLLAFALGLAGHVPMTTLLDVGALVATGAVALMLLTILVSGAESNRRRQSGPVALFALCIFVIPYLFMLAANWEDFFPEGAHGWFFGWKLRLVPLVSTIVLYFGIWSYAGLVRRFRHEREPLFTPRCSIGFTVGWIALAVGLYWPVLSPDDPGLYVGLWIVLLPPLLLLPIGTARRHGHLVESLATGGQMPRLFPPRGNLRPGIVNILLWTAVSFWLRPTEHNVYLVVIGLATFWLVTLFLHEATVVCEPMSPRIQHLSLVIAILYIGLPPLLAGVLRAENLLWFSPVGYLTSLLSSARYGPGGQGSVEVPLSALLSVPLVNGVFLLMLGRLIQRRYRALSRPDPRPLQAGCARARRAGRGSGTHGAA